MSQFAKRLRELRNSRNISQQKLSEYVKIISKSSINMYERGEREPNFETLEALADFFNVDMNYILGKSDVPNQALNAVQSNAPTITEDFTTFPVIGEVAAGYDHIAIEDWEGDIIDIPNSYLKGHGKDDFFVLRVMGDSMYPTYHENDHLLILKRSTVDSGSVAVVVYDDEISTLKRVEYKKGEDWLKLIPINPNYPPIKIEDERLEHCKVIGIPKLLVRIISE